MDLAWGGIGRPFGAGLIPEGHWAFPRALQSSWSHDLARAKRLLAEAGYSSGFDAGELVGTVQSATAAESVLNNLNAIGIRARFRIMERVAYLTAWKDKKGPGMGLYYLGLVTSVLLLVETNLWQTLEFERVASYVPKGQRLRAWVTTMVVSFAVLGLLGVAWLDLLGSPLASAPRVGFLRVLAFVSWSGSSRILFPSGLVLALIWARWNARTWCVTL
jgi:hypothetical protein